MAIYYEGLNMVIVVLMGRSGCGKSTNEKLLEELGYSRIISYTTRPMRAGEENHREYHFVSREEFENLVKNDMLVEWAEYNGNYYGAPKPVGSDKYVAVLETDGFKQFKDMYGCQVFGVYLKTSNEAISERLQQRNNTSENIIKSRVDEDDKKFAQVEKLADAVVDGNSDTATVFNDILKEVRYWRYRYDI